MKKKINKFFKKIGGEPKDVTFMESFKIFPFLIIMIVAIALMVIACENRNPLLGVCSLLFAWQIGWGMSIQRFVKSKQE